MHTASLILVSALFGGFGAALRMLAILALTERRGVPMRLTVLAVNVAGSAVAGACTAAFARVDPRGIAGAAVIGGILGGFTTFSSFAIESIEMWQRGDRLRAARYAIASIAACGFSAWIGFELAGSLVS
jgi:CrcB protein